MLAENMKAKAIPSKSLYLKVKKTLLIPMNWAQENSNIANILEVGIQKSQLRVNDVDTTVGIAGKGYNPTI